MVLALLIVLFIGWGLTKSNPYIERHKLKIDNDKKYSDYLKWCLSLGYIPMDKKDFIKEIEDKEKSLERLVK